MSNRTCLFGYRCPECREGRVRTVVASQFETCIEGDPFTVKNAVVGICDSCNTTHFAPDEVERWEGLYLQANRESFLSAGQIRELRRSLDLTMEDFAALIGSTRQSIYNWEMKDRASDQSRMADLLLKLVQRSAKEQSLDVIEFLLEQAEQLGHKVELAERKPRASYSLSVRKVKKSATRGVQLAASSAADGEDAYMLYRDDTGEPFGELEYDTRSGSVIMQVFEEPDRCLDVDISLEDSPHYRRLSKVSLETGEARILNGETIDIMDRIDKIRLHRRTTDGEES